MVVRRTASTMNHLSEIGVSLLQEREKTIVELTKAHEMNSQWLGKTLESYKRKILDEAIPVTQIDTVPQPIKKSKFDAHASTKAETQSEKPVEKSKPGIIQKQLNNVKRVFGHEPSKESNSLPQVDFSTHPQYLPVMAMKVVQLRKKLKEKNLNSTGLKKELQARLLEAIIAEENDTLPRPIQENQTDSASSSRPSKKSNEGNNPIEMEESPERHSEEETAKINIETTEQRNVLEQTKTEVEKPHTEKMRPSLNSGSKPQVKSSVAEELSGIKSIVRSTAKLFSPKKNSQMKSHCEKADKSGGSSEPQKNSSIANIKKSLVKTASAILSHTQSIEPDSHKSACSQAHLSESVTVSSSAEFKKCAEVATSSSKPTLGNQSSCPPSSSVVKTAKEKQKEFNETRKQKIADIRNKSKAITFEKSGTVKQMALAANANMMKGCPTGDAPNKHSALNAKIREKYAASKNKGLIPKQLVTTASSTKISTAFKELDSNINHGQTLPMLLNSHQKSSTPKPRQKSVEIVRSPMDTYEISDREDSESDESEYSSDDEDKPEKKIPGWAKKMHLHKALLDQYDKKKNGTLDPDSIFPEVETCDLAAIFDQKKTRYKKRTSSGNWTKDRVTVAEKLTYKRTMGYSVHS